MKRKILTTATAAIAAIFCAFGLTACGGNEGGKPEPNALEKAFENHRQTQNVTVAVTDSRTVKHGNDYSASVKIDYAGKAAYTKYSSSTITDNLGTTHKINHETYYEIDGNKPAFTIYDYTLFDETEAQGNWSKVDRSDIFNLPEASADPQKFEIQTLTGFVNSYLPSHALSNTCWRVSENSEYNFASLDTSDLLNKFSESANSYSASLYMGINSGSGAYTFYACAVTVKLDAQNRFDEVDVDFGSNGNITAKYVYGATTVTIPAEAKNAHQIN